MTTRTRATTPDSYKTPILGDVLVYATDSKRSRRQDANCHALVILEDGYACMLRRDAQTTIRQFVTHAMAHPSTRYFVTRLGPNPKDVAPMFVINQGVPFNIGLPADYWTVIDRVAPPPKPPAAVAEARERRRASYSAYMESAHWQELRIKVFERWGKMCLNDSSEEEIEAHHIRYRPDLTTCTTDDVIPLCRRCHGHYHLMKQMRPEQVLPILEAPQGWPMVQALRDFFRRTGLKRVTCTSRPPSPPPLPKLDPNAYKRRWVAYSPREVKVIAK